MLVNKDTAISTPSILLVPYEAHHVPTYHEWMKDEALQAATASEPLALPAEHDMQQSWRTDADKLTFIVCKPLPLSSSSSSSPPSSYPARSNSLSPIQAQKFDTPSTMIGDVNLFLIVKDFDENEAEDMQYLSGELELMIASKENQGQGFGRATLLAFLQYLEVHVQDILREFLEGEERQGRQVLAARELQLGVKIGKENVRSVGLFESLGFERVGGDNYFGEVELKLPRTLNGVEKGKGRWLVEEYRELVYARGGVVEH